MKTSELYRSAARIETAIEGIHKTGQSLQLEMHKVACSVLKHLGEHKDIRMVQKLLNAMPEMSRQNALREWFAAFGPVTFGASDSIFYDKDKSCKLGDAMAKPFWKFKANEGSSYEPLNVDKQLDALIAKLRKDALQLNIDHSATINALVLLKAKPVDPKMVGAGSAGSVDPLSI